MKLAKILVAFLFSSTFCVGLPHGGQAKEVHGAERALNKLRRGQLVHFADGKLTVVVKDITLGKLLEEIARQSNLTLILSGSLDEKTSIEFYQLPLEQSIRRILSQQNFIMEYAHRAEKEDPPRFTTLWVIPKGKGNSIQDRFLEYTQARVPKQQDATQEIASLEAALVDEDPSKRELAVDALGQTAMPQAVIPISSALQDSNEEVRISAIVALAQIGGAEAADSLLMALQDKSSIVRETAEIALRQMGRNKAGLIFDELSSSTERSARNFPDKRGGSRGRSR